MLGHCKLDAPDSTTHIAFEVMNLPYSKIDAPSNLLISFHFEEYKTSVLLIIYHYHQAHIIIPFVKLIHSNYLFSIKKIPLHFLPVQVFFGKSLDSSTGTAV